MAIAIVITATVFGLLGWILSPSQPASRPSATPASTVSASASTTKPAATPPTSPTSPSRNAQAFQISGFAFYQTNVIIVHVSYLYAGQSFKGTVTIGNTIANFQSEGSHTTAQFFRNGLPTTGMATVEVIANTGAKSSAKVDLGYHPDPVPTMSIMSINDMYVNPWFTISSPAPGATYAIANEQGVSVQLGTIEKGSTSNSSVITTAKLSPGTYTLILIGENDVPVARYSFVI